MHSQHARRAEFDSLSERIIGCAFHVLNTLGSGFAEKVYENALVIELRKVGLTVAQQQAITIRYEEQVVGEYFADLMVEEKILVELKVARVLDEGHHLQCVNYLKGSGLQLCLLLNFSRPRLEMKRIVNGW